MPKGRQQLYLLLQFNTAVTHPQAGVADHISPFPLGNISCWKIHQRQPEPDFLRHGRLPYPRPHTFPRPRPRPRLLFSPSPPAPSLTSSLCWTETPVLPPASSLPPPTPPPRHPPPCHPPPPPLPPPPHLHLIRSVPATPDTQGLIVELP